MGGKAIHKGRLLRLGILGGTFDPIHLGHLRLAEDIAEALELAKIYLIPAALPPHKKEHTISSFQYRLAMTRLAAEESPLFEALDLEGRRGGLSFSIETLRELRSQFGTEPEIFFIIGLDAFLLIETWKEYRSLFEHAHFVIIERPGVPSGHLESFLKSLGSGFEKRGGTGLSYTAPSGNVITYKKATRMEISSTDIRKRVANGRSIRFLVPESIREYIIDKRLYRTDEDD